MKSFNFLVLLLLVSACANSEKAEGLARKFAKQTYPGYQIVASTCEVGDSDGDGRVRCNLSVRKDADSEIKTDFIECPAGWLPQPLTTKCVGIGNKGFFR